ERVLDIGFGSIGQLRLFAQMGADATGVDVDPFARWLYADAQGSVGAHRGEVKTVFGFWPAGDGIPDAVGGNLKLMLTKNTHKKGYIHPEQPADDRLLIHLGVEDAQYLKAVYDALEPGGYFMIYNICPAPAPEGQPFIPWSDGRSPFSTEQYEKAGFEVLS